jgi:hypothetical protein
MIYNFSYGSSHFIFKYLILYIECLRFLKKWLLAVRKNRFILSVPAICYISLRICLSNWHGNLCVRGIHSKFFASYAPNSVGTARPHFRSLLCCCDNKYWVRLSIRNDAGFSLSFYFWASLFLWQIRALKQKINKNTDVLPNFWGPLQCI